jgi:hypothetical protein
MAGSFTDAKGSSIPVELNNGVVEVFVRNGSGGTLLTNWTNWDMRRGDLEE